MTHDAAIQSNVARPRRTRDSNQVSTGWPQRGSDGTLLRGERPLPLDSHALRLCGRASSREPES